MNSDRGAEPAGRRLDVTDEPAASSLAGIRYGRRAFDLARFLDDPVDETIAAVVRGAGVRPPEERDRLRAAIDADGCYSLLTFADRRSAAAIRKGSLAESHEAIQALTLVTLSKIDYRDLSVDFSLYAVGRLGGDPSGAVASAAAASEPGTRASFTAKADRAAHLTLEDCALVEVRSRYGLGFMETEARSYAPRADLTGIAVRAADRIDETGRYSVEYLHLSSLPGIWFGRDAGPIGDIPVTGCVSVSASIAGRSRWEQGLLLFVAELKDAQTATGLARRAEAASTPDRPRIADTADRLLSILIGGSASLGQKPVETEASLRAIGEVVRKELAHA